MWSEEWSIVSAFECYFCSWWCWWSWSTLGGVELNIVRTHFLAKRPILPHLKHLLSLFGLFDLGVNLLSELWGDLIYFWCLVLSMSIFVIDSRISFRSLLVFFCYQPLRTWLLIPGMMLFSRGSFVDHPHIQIQIISLFECILFTSLFDPIINFYG